MTFQLIRKHKLREEYALIWFAASLAIFLLSIFDSIVAFLATIFAVKYAPTLILVFGILFCVVLLLAQTVMLSVQANRIRDLAQSVGLLEWRLRELENQAPEDVQLSLFADDNHPLTHEVQMAHNSQIKELSS
ncbi:N/A [soil metagenome]